MVEQPIELQSLLPNIVQRNIAVFGPLVYAGCR